MSEIALINFNIFSQSINQSKTIIILQSSTLGYQSTHSPTYSVGLLPNIKSIKGISSRVNEQAHIVIYDSLEHMQICLEAFISFITQYSGDNNVENNYIL